MARRKLEPETHHRRPSRHSRVPQLLGFVACCIYRTPISMAHATTLLCLGLAPAVHATGSAAVISQNLKSAAASTKVAAAIWTRRSDRYTLQIAFPRWNEGLLVSEDGEIKAPHAVPPGVTVWLLRADGTAIPTRKEVPLQGETKDPSPASPAEIAYAVDLAEGEKAVAAAIRIDDEYYIEPLQTLVTN